MSSIKWGSPTPLERGWRYRCPGFLGFAAKAGCLASCASLLCGVESSGPVHMDKKQRKELNHTSTELQTLEMVSLSWTSAQTFLEGVTPNQTGTARFTRVLG